MSQKSRKKNIASVVTDCIKNVQEQMPDASVFVYVGSRKPPMVYTDGSNSSLLDIAEIAVAGIMSYHEELLRNGKNKTLRDATKDFFAIIREAIDEAQRSGI